MNKGFTDKNDPAGNEWLYPKKSRKRIIIHICLTIVVMVLLSYLLYLFRVPNPGIVLMTALVVFTSLYGYASGIVGGIIVIGFSMYYFSTDNSIFEFDLINLHKILIIAVGVVINVMFIGHLKKKQVGAMQKLEEYNRVLELDNSVLEEATVTDPLTGVKNRFALRREYIEYEGHDICVMMLDIDDFKHINDNYGHSVGDYVLKQTGNALITVFGKEGCYRYGGDEFLVIGEKTGKEEFSLLIEKLKKHLEEILIEEGSADRVNFSGGYVCGNARLNDDLRLMMSQADANLYKAKNTGKNRYIGTDYSRLAAERTDRNTVDILK